MRFFQDFQIPEDPLKSLGNFWGNWFTNFVISNIKFLFTYENTSFYKNILKFQNFMTRIAWKCLLPSTLQMMIQVPKKSTQLR